jgi:predicted GH43/DUF377 family glycosyl hydrolase
MALLDLDDPTKLIKRVDPWIMGPREDYEYRGDVPGVVFPTGAIVDEEENKLRIYYGAADSSIGMAVADLDDVLTYMSKC